MPLLKRKCRDCGNANVKLSRKGLCEDCILERCLKPSREIKAKKGEFFDRYKAGILKYLNIENKPDKHGAVKKAKKKKGKPAR